MTADRIPLFARPRFAQGTLLLGLVAAVLLALGALFDSTQFFRSYLLGFIVWLEPALGCLALLMLFHLVGGAWGRAVRPFLEAGALTVPLMAVFFLVLLFGLGELYPWTHEELVAESHYLEHKQAYLNLPFWVGRAAIYFAVWTALAVPLARWTAVQAATADDNTRLSARGRAAALSAPGLILFVLAANFASYDWTMSLEPEWYSSMYGFLFITQQAPVVLALLILSSVNWDRSGRLAGFMQPTAFRDLGTLLFAFTIIWAYSSFFQFMLIWSGNLPHEVTWYRHRSQGGWQYLAIFVFLFHFCLPFFILLSRRVRGNFDLMPWIAGGLWLVHLVYLFWFIVPSFHPGDFAFSWMDLAAVLAIGALWLRCYLWLLGARPVERQPDAEPAAREAGIHG